MKQLLIRKVLPVAGAVALFGGSAVFGDGAVPGDDLEPEVRQDYAAAGETVRDVDCDSLDGEVGATATCEVTTTGGATQRVRATVGSVDGQTVNYRMARVR